MVNLVKRSCGLIVCLLGVLMTVGLYSSAAMATEVYSGYIGESALTWELTDGILTIGGSGEAPIFASHEDPSNSLNHSSKVDSNLVAFDINSTERIVPEVGTLTLPCPAKISATSQSLTGQQILKIVFIVDWATTM